MNVYEEDSDSFSEDYLNYIKTLTSEVFKGSVRITRNPNGELVRFEFWIDDSTGVYKHYDFPFPGWMKP